MPGGAGVGLVHELSIARRLVELVGEHVRGSKAGAVTAVTIRLGDLVGLHEDALRFGFAIAGEGTPCAAADLRIVRVPVTIWCRACGRAVPLPDIRRLACPACGRPGGDVRAGRELDLESIEVTDHPPRTEAIA